ncbi:hypothetical protein [Bacteroides sp.]
MRYIYLLLLLIPLKGMAQQSTQSMDSILKDTFNIPFLQDIVEYYFYYYYDFPNESSELIRFTKKIAKEVSLQYYNADKLIWKVTIPKLEYYKDDLDFQREDTYSFEILLFDTLLAKCTDNYNFVPHPCDIAEYARESCENYRFFLSQLGRIPIFYNQENEPIIYPEYVSYSENVKMKLGKLKKEYIEKSSYRYHKACKIPLYTFYEYRAGAGLFFYCTGENVNLENLYFKELETYLSSLCKERQITKIIFLAPEL